MRPSTDGNFKRDGKSTMPKVSADCKSGAFFNKDAGCSSLYGASSKLNRSSKGISISVDFISIFCILCLDAKDIVNSTNEKNDLSSLTFLMALFLYLRSVIEFSSCKLEMTFDINCRKLGQI